MPIKISDQEIEQILELDKREIDPREIATAVGVGLQQSIKSLGIAGFLILQQLLNYPRVVVLLKLLLILLPVLRNSACIDIFQGSYNPTRVNKLEEVFGLVSSDCPTRHKIFNLTLISQSQSEAFDV